MKKQLFFVLALIGLMLMGGGINLYAEEITIGRTLEYKADATYQVTKNEKAQVTIEDGKGPTATGKDLFYKTTTSIKFSNAAAFRDKIPGGTSNLTEFNENCYAGVKIVIADGYKISMSQIKARVAVFNNFTYRVIVTDGVNTYYTSKDKAINNYNKTSATNLDATIAPSTPIELTGTVYVRLHYWNTNNSGSKYLAPLELTITGNLQEAVQYTVTSNVSPAVAGSVTMNPESGVVTSGGSVTLTANANTGYRFENWTDALGNELSKNADYSYKPTANATVNANFIKLNAVNFSLTGTEANGFAPEPVYGLAGEEVDFPNSQLMYAAGKTLTAWTDGTNTYPISGKYTVTSAESVTLTPVFTDNTVSLLDATSDVTVSWKLGSQYAPVLAFENGTNWNNVQGNAYLVQQAVVNGQTIDVGMMFETRSLKTGLSGNGKIYNIRDDDWAQVNNNTVFRIPVVRNSKITMKANKKIHPTTIDGKKDYDTETTDLVYTYNGDAKEIDIVICSGSYYSEITVTYPPSQSFSLTTADTEPYSLYLDYPVTIPEGIEAYTGALDAAEETLTMKEVEGTIPANTAVIVKSATADTYVFKETYTAAAIESNSLKGVTADTDIATLVTAGKTLLTLGTKGGKVAFRKPATGTTQVKANKAYLLVNTPSSEGAKTVKMIFDGETTGISEFTANEDVTNAPLFNLNGQRVNANAKGLLIKNGKKIIIK